MGFWKFAGKEWNKQDGNGSKEKRRKEWREHERKRMRKKKMNSHQQISWLWCKTSYCSYRKIRKTWFSELGMGGAEEKNQWERERDKQREREREKICVWVVFVYNCWIAYMPCVSHPI